MDDIRDCAYASSNTSKLSWKARAINSGDTVAYSATQVPFVELHSQHSTLTVTRTIRTVSLKRHVAPTGFNGKKSCKTKSNDWTHTSPGLLPTRAKARTSLDYDGSSARNATKQAQSHAIVHVSSHKATLKSKKSTIPATTRMHRPRRSHPAGRFWPPPRDVTMRCTRWMSNLRGRLADDEGIFMRAPPGIKLQGPKVSQILDESSILGYLFCTTFAIRLSFTLGSKGICSHTCIYNVSWYTIYYQVLSSLTRPLVESLGYPRAACCISLRPGSSDRTQNERSKPTSEAAPQPASIDT